MGEYEDVLKQLREGEIDGEEAAEKLEKWSGSSLRKRAEGKEAADARLAELESENKRLKSAPKIAEALKKAGVDFEALRPAERKLIDSLEFEGDDPAEDWVAKVVSENGLPVTEGAGSEGQEGEEPPAAAVARQAKGSPAGGGVSSGVVTPDTFASWPMDKRMEFINKHPEAEEMLGKGLPMTGVAVK